MAHIILFENINFHVFSGQWDFFRNSNFQTSYGVVLSKNIYPYVGDVGIRNDDMSSLSPR